MSRRIRTTCGFADPIIGLGNLTLVHRGEGASLFEGSFLGKATIFKQRHRIRDKNLKKVMQKSFIQEVRSLLKARKLGIRTPVIYFVESAASTIYMEKVQGITLKELLLRGLAAKGLTALLRDICKMVAKLHDSGLIHGNLTTSNILVRDGDEAMVLMEFGLSRTSTLEEDKAMDLYALESTVTDTPVADVDVFNRIVATYRQFSKKWCPVLDKYAEVRMRERNRAMAG